MEDPALAAGSLIDTMEDPTSGGMADVAAGAAGLVGVGSTCLPAPGGCSAAVWISTDGASWQRASIPSPGGPLGSVAATGYGFVAIGSGSVLTSADGRTWTRTAIPQGGEFGTVTVIGDRLFLTALGGSTGVWVSPDGTAWSPASVQGGIAPTEPTLETNRWRFTAREDVAVLFAPSWTSSEPMVWVSPIGG